MVCWERGDMPAARLGPAPLLHSAAHACQVMMRAAVCWTEGDVPAARRIAAALSAAGCACCLLRACSCAPLAWQALTASPLQLRLRVCSVAMAAPPGAESRPMDTGCETCRHAGKKLVIVSYELMAKEAVMAICGKEKYFKVVVCDESHYIKSKEVRASLHGFVLHWVCIVYGTGGASEGWCGFFCSRWMLC
jgi:hypothetical protein